MWNQFLGKGNAPSPSGGGGGASAPPPVPAAATAADPLGNSAVTMAADAATLAFAAATASSSAPSPSIGVAAPMPPAAAASLAPNVMNSMPPSQLFVGAGFAAAEPTATNAMAANAATAPAALPVGNIINTATVTRKKKKLSVFWQGRKFAVTVKANNHVVSAPNSGDDDSGDGMGMENHGMGSRGYDEGIERSTSGSTNKTDISNTSFPMDLSPSNNPNAEAEEPPRRGRSDSIGKAIEAPLAFSTNTSTSSDNPAGVGGSAAAGHTSFEAALLLGIADTSQALGEDKKREPVDPTTLPTSMTSFLDMLSEDQRRVRHRHIPGVDGFRKLYKSEVKSDMSEARRIKRKIKERDADAMEVEVEVNEDETLAAVAGDGGAVSNNLKQEEEEEEKKFPDRDAFVAPSKDVRAFANGGQLASMIESNDFENAMRPGAAMSSSAPGINNGSSNGSNTTNGNGNGSNSLQSPRFVASLTTFSPPRPQESTALKTQHRLRRWEANPREAESDLASYRKTVHRTREELHSAEFERERIERIASLVRGHFAGHLVGYKREMAALNEEMQGLNGNCVELEEVYNGRSMSTRGGVSVRGMKDVLGTLMGLGEDGKGAVGAGSSLSAASVDTSALVAGGPNDWRTVGAGGVCSSKSNDQETALANGWLFVGDDVLVGHKKEEGKVVYADLYGPEDDGKKKKNINKKSPGDAMDIDSVNNKKGGETSSNNQSEDMKQPCTVVGVSLTKTGDIRNVPLKHLQFNTDKLAKLTHSDADLAKRWERMLRTALAHGVSHDDLAMGEYINASLAHKAQLANAAAAAGEDEEGEAKKETNETGSASPKCVAQYSDEKMVLPFGSGLIAAPGDVHNFPSVIPLDTLEERVRKVTYEAEGPRVIPTMAPFIKEHEARQEEQNALKGKVLQLRNRLSRQKRLRALNERSLAAGKGRSHKVEGLLLEMQMDLKNLKERLQDELNELGIGNNSPMPLASGENDESVKEADNDNKAMIDNPDDRAPPNEVEKVTVEEEKSVSSMQVEAKAGATAEESKSAADGLGEKQPAESKESVTGVGNVVKEGAIGSSENPTTTEPQMQKDQATTVNIKLPAAGTESSSMVNEEPERESKRPRVEE